MNIDEIMASQPKDQTEQREKTVCIGCGQPKQQGLVVCWGCFKGGTLPFKDFQGSIADWLTSK